MTRRPKHDEAAFALVNGLAFAAAVLLVLYLLGWLFNALAAALTRLA